MRINIYTEELLSPPSILNEEVLDAEIVTAEYTSSRTGQLMTNYGLRVYFKSHPALHYIPGRDDDRSAVTFWCGDTNQNILKLLSRLTYVAEQFNLEHHRSKVQAATSAAEIAEHARKESL